MINKKIMLLFLPIFLLPSCGKSKFNFDCETYLVYTSKHKDGPDPYAYLYKKVYIDKTLGLEAKALLLDIVNSDYDRMEFNDSVGAGYQSAGWYRMVFNDSYNKLILQETYAFPRYFIEYSDGTKSDKTMTEINRNLVERKDLLIRKLKPILEPLPWVEWSELFK